MVVVWLHMEKFGFSIVQIMHYQLFTKNWFRYVCVWIECDNVLSLNKLSMIYKNIDLQTGFRKLLFKLISE